MRSVIRGLASDNGTLRGLTGQGEPGLWTLLGGTGAELDSEGYTLGGGSGQVSSTSRLARTVRDIQLAAVASGTVPGKPYDPPEPGDPKNPIVPIVQPGIRP